MSIFDPFVDVAAKTVDVVTSVIDRTPGFSDVKKFFVENPVVGQIVFTAMGTALMSSFANVAIPSVSGMQTVGPVIASVAFAVPGMAFKGESFTKAYVTDLTARTTALIAYFAQQKAGQVAEKLPAATEEARKQFTEPLTRFVKDSGLQAEINRTLSDFARQQLGKDPSQLTPNEAKAALDRAGLDPVKLAARKGVRPDVAALGINGIAGVNIYSAGDPAYADYDVLGNAKPGTTERPGAPLPNVVLAQLQENLRTLGYRVVGALGVGSENDPTIVASVRDFQAKNALPVTGTADAQTRQLLQTAVGLPRVAAEVRAAPQPTFSRELQAARAGVAAAPQPLLPQLVTFAILTSPAWFAFLVLPRLRARARVRTAKAKRR